MSANAIGNMNRFGEGWKRVLEPQEFEKAVFVDFEARTNGPQVVLGVLTPDSDFTQYVVDPVFEPAAEASYKGSRPKCWCLPVTLREAVQAAIRAARRSGGPIVGFSIHEMLVVDALLPELSSDWIEAYRDGKRTARRWSRRFRPDYEFTYRPRTGKYTLDQFFRLVGYEVPRMHSPGNTGQRLAYVRDQIERRGNYQALSPTAKGKWTNVLMHNFHDIHGLRELLRTATSELAGS